MTAGSPLWQTIFLSFALVLVAFEIVRGWRLGLVRQVVRLIALAAAYGSGVFGGRILLPVLRPLLRVPDFLITVVSGALLGLLIYALITGAGAVLFKRTGQQRTGVVRLLYGAAGALLGVFFGLFSVWLIVVGIRSLGAIANAEVRHEIEPPPFQLAPHPRAAPERAKEPPPIVASLAKLKNSLELGSLGEVVKGVDLVPDATYSSLGKLGAIVSDPRSAERFLSFRGAQALAQNPHIVALREDPEIAALIEQQRFLDLLQNPKVIRALNDPNFAAEVRRFDLQKALDYALPPAPRR